MSGSRWTVSDARAIAGGFVQRLPAATAAADHAAGITGVAKRQAVTPVCLIYVAIAGAYLYALSLTAPYC